jgi:hypothetical protein
MMTRTLSLTAIAFAGLALSSGAMAQVKTWNFGDTTNPGSCTGSYSAGSNTNYGNAINCTQQPSGTVVDLVARAYSSDGSSSTFRTAGVNQQGTGSGFGVYNQTEGTSAGSPNHAMDNSTPGIDMLLLQFSAAEILKRVTIGWSGSDGDFQVLRWTGATNATATTVGNSIVGKQASALLGSGGWELVTTVDGAGGIDNPDVHYGVNSNNLSSSFWLITAYNSAFGGTSLSTGNDAIKVLGVSTGMAVSAPGTLALAGLGLLGMGALRRRRA